jgi:hypothetical protein
MHFKAYSWDGSKTYYTWARSKGVAYLNFRMLNLFEISDPNLRVKLHGSIGCELDYVDIELAPEKEEPEEEDDH